ncbi:hypothetical protein ACF3NG_10810 [Aerococcaceae bacterium WGS1372]
MDTFAPKAALAASSLILSAKLPIFYASNPKFITTSIALETVSSLSPATAMAFSHLID